MKLKIQHKVLRVKNLPFNYLIPLGFLILLNIAFFPKTAHKRYNIKEGEIANIDIIAPYEFSIPRTEDELEKERNKIARRIPPVFNLDNSIPQNVSQMIGGLTQRIDSLKKYKPKDSLVALIQEKYPIPTKSVEFLLKSDYHSILKKIEKRFAGLYKKGIVDKKDGHIRFITIISGDKEIIESNDELYSITEAESIVGLNETLEFRRLARFFTIPNVLYDEIKTKERIDEVFSNVSLIKGKVLKGEIIVEKHKRVTAEAIEKIRALEESYKTGRPKGFLKTIILRNLFFLSFLLFLIYFDRMHNLDLFHSKNLYYFSFLFVIYLIMCRVTYETNLFYLLPISFFTILMGLYFNFNVAFILTTLFALLPGAIFNSLRIFLFLFASGITASFSSRSLKTRLSLYRPMLYIALTNIIAIFFIELSLYNEKINLAKLGAGLLNSILGGVGIALFLPLLERLFDFTTDLTLLELGNLNLPIFKEMAINAPGTYHHSVVVGNLTEAGATAIGADPILARVAAYYHDIGKLKKPEYFIENQMDKKNPHDSLKPGISALVIISHVKDGVEMAKKIKLPKKLISIIAEHHGSLRIETFYRKALNTSERISEDAFRYPGPKPKTKEAALVMLADGVEATVRAERHITLARLQKIIKENFDKRFNDGQLDECPLNRYELEQIKVSFLPILKGIFHPRIDYEEESQAKENPPI